MKTLLTTVLLSFAGVVFAGEVNPQPRYEATLDAYGFLFHTDVYEAQLKDAPLWSEAAPYPPLSPRKAMQAATQFITNSIASAEPWAIESILLKDLSDGHWIYVVQFEYTGPPAARAGSWPPVEICVLMNGEVATTIVIRKTPNQASKGIRPPADGSRTSSV